MAKKRRFDFTKKNKRSGKVENVGYLDLEQDEEQSRCSLYFYGDIVSATWESMWYDLKDIKRESRENREEMKTLRERVVIVEQSLKSYHKRLDGEQHSDR